MPSFGDTAIIALLALLLFGPKKLPELARQLGKLMGEFRRASNEFRMQMEDEFRASEQADQQKKIAAMEAAAPVTPQISQSITPHVEFDPDQPYIPPTAPEDIAAETDRQNTSDASTTIETAPEVLPIASSGDLHLMPPETGLPVGRSNSIGEFSEPAPTPQDSPSETPTHG